ncbi:AAA family ATPase [bacterium]|nr:AAA family ATPase [bacterium]
MEDYVRLESIIMDADRGSLRMSGSDYEYLNAMAVKFAKRYMRQAMSYRASAKHTDRIIQDLRENIPALKQHELDALIIANFQDPESLAIMEKGGGQRRRPKHVDDGQPVEGQVEDYLSGWENEILAGLLQCLPFSRNVIWVDFLLENSFSHVAVEGRSAFEDRLDDMVKSLGLSTLERELVICLYCVAVKSDLPDMIHMHNSFDEQVIRGNLHAILGCSKAEASRVIANDSILRKSGVLTILSRTGALDLSEETQEFLAGLEAQTYFESVLHRVDTAGASLEDCSVSEGDKNFLVKMLQETPGSNVLLYGLAGHGKTTLAIAAAQAAGRKVYQIPRKKDHDFDSRKGLLRTAAIILRGRDDAVLMVDEADKILCTESVWQMFGERGDKAWLNEFIPDNEREAQSAGQDRGVDAGRFCGRTRQRNLEDSIDLRAAPFCHERCCGAHCADEQDGNPGRTDPGLSPDAGHGSGVKWRDRTQQRSGSLPPVRQLQP